ncbi:MAG: hypothetical protein ABEJ58_09805 [Halodesulfurarchaeum sp.]
MALHAVDDLSDAFSATREFLFPFSWGRWLRLALISLFVAGGSGGGMPTNGFQYTMDGTTGPVPDLPGGGPELGTLLQQNLGIVLLIGGIVLLVSLVLAWLAATMEFALLESIRSDSVRIRSYVREYSGLGTRLFAFRVVFGLGLLIVFGGLALMAIGPVVLGGGGAPLLALLVLVPVFFVLAILASVVYVLTNAFVAPIMLLDDRGVLAAWSRFWQTLKTDYTQFLVYLLVGIFVMIAVGIAMGIVAAVLGLIVALPFAVVFFVFFMGGIAPFGPVLLVLIAIPLALLFIALMAFVQVPVQVYLRYWALMVLGDVDSDLDLIPEQRSTIRSPQEE